MLPVIRALLAYLVSMFRLREALRLENMALRHQVAVYHRTVHRPRFPANGSPVLVLACPPMGKMAGRARLRAALHGPRVATEAVPGVLATVGSRPQARPTRSRQRNPSVD